MGEKNVQALAQAYRAVERFIAFVKEHNLTADTTEDESDTLIEKLSDIKMANDDGGKLTRKKAEEGQEWYVNHMIMLLKLPDMQARLDHEYKSLFADNADESEMLSELDKLMAA